MNAAVIAVAAKAAKYKRIFRQAGATSVYHPIVPEEHGVHHCLIFKKLVRDGVFVPVGVNRYYLNEARDLQIRKSKITVVVSIIILLLFVMAITMVMVGY